MGAVEETELVVPVGPVGVVVVVPVLPVGGGVSRSHATAVTSAKTRMRRLMASTPTDSAPRGGDCLALPDHSRA